MELILNGRVKEIKCDCGEEYQLLLAGRFYPKSWFCLTCRNFVVEPKDIEMSDSKGYNPYHREKTPEERLDELVAKTKSKEKESK